MPMLSTRDQTKGGLPLFAWWLVGSVLVLVFMLRDYLMSSGGVIGHAVYWGRDFINVWTGGQLIRSGHIATLYNLADYARYQRHLFGNIEPHNYSYPPISFPLAVVFSSLPYWLALTSWIVGTGALFLWAVRPWWPERAGPFWLAVLTPAAIVNIWAGHYGFLLGALFLLGWQRLDKRPHQAGIFFGLMLIKPQLAVLIPVVLVIRGEWKAMSSAALTILMVVGGTTLAYGWGPWQEFLLRTSAVQAGMIDARGMFFQLMTCSTASAILDLTENWPLAIVGQLLSATFATVLVIIAVRRRVATRDLALIIATATVLFVPYSFNYDLTVVMIGAVDLLTRSKLAPLDHRLALYGFLAPQLGMVLANYGAPVMPLMLAGLLLAQVKIAAGAPLFSIAAPVAVTAARSS